MDTLVMAALLLVMAFEVWRLRLEVDELRLDVSELLANTDETHALLVELALEDGGEATYLTYAGEGDEDYCTYTANGVTE